MLRSKRISSVPPGSSRSRPHSLRPKWRHHERPDLVARARQLVEESGLGREAIAAALGVGVATVTNWRRRFGWVWAPHRRGGRPPALPGAAWPKLSRRAGPGREHPPATVASVRRLLEAGASRAEAAAETGVSVQTIRRWAAREGWRCPPRRRRGIVRRSTGRPCAPSAARRTGSVPAPGPLRSTRDDGGVARPQRFRGGRGRRYVPDVVERVRVLVEGSGLGEADIAARTGVSQSTVSRWTHRHGWRRPAEAPRWTRLMATERAGLGARLVAALGRLAVLADGEAGRADPSPAGEGESALADRGGVAPRPGSPHPGSPRRGDSALPSGEGSGAAEIAGACRRLAGHLGRAGDRSAPRLLRPPPRPRDRPRREALVEEARDLVEHTLLRQSEIATRLGLSRQTLTGWAQVGGWVRRPGAPSPYGGPARSAARTIRLERRVEARRRLGEAERALDALERGEVAEAGRLDAVRAAFGALAATVEIAQRPCGPAGLADGPAALADGPVVRVSGASRSARRRRGSGGASA